MMPSGKATGMPVGFSAIARRRWPKPMVEITVRISLEQKEALEKYAREHSLTRNMVLRGLIFAGVRV